MCQKLFISTLATNTLCGLIIVIVVYPRMLRKRIMSKTLAGTWMSHMNLLFGQAYARHMRHELSLCRVVLAWSVHMHAPLGCHTIGLGCHKWSFCILGTMLDIGVTSCLCVLYVCVVVVVFVLVFVGCVCVVVLLWL